MSSWLLDAAGAGGRRQVAGAGLRRPAQARLSPRRLAARVADGGMSFIAGFAGGGAAGFAGAGSGGGFFGSRRLGFVVGNDTPDRRQNLLHRGLLDLCRLRHLRLHIINALACFYTKQEAGFAGSGYAGRDFHRTSLTCPQIKRRTTSRGIPPPPRAPKRRGPRQPDAARIALLPRQERYVTATFDCKQRRAHDPQSLHSRPKSHVRAEQYDNAERRGDKVMRSSIDREHDANAKPGFICLGSRAEVRDHSRQALTVQAISVPSGVRTPNQLSRTC